MTIISSNISTTTTDGYDISGFNVHLTVEQGVNITTEAGDDGINMGTGGFDWAQNNGSINAGAGVYAEGSQDFVWNSATGEIFGYNGIYSDANDNMIQNDGEIVATSYGVGLFADDNFVVNHGEISSNFAGIGLSGNSEKLDNDGTISGNQYSIQSFGGTGLTILNYGTLDGDVSLADTGTTFLNRGLVVGDVTFGNGSNVFKGSAGQVTGTITGGADEDIIHLGGDGETADGGAGKNVIYSGAGSDTFIYSAMGPGNTTNIIGFNAAMDTIELESSVFTSLVAGETPTFSIASKATSKTDYLFYNSATGGLYYDADGSGKGAAVLLGLVGAGVHLTANNFAVV